MRVIKCDLCKKNIKNQPVTAGIGYFTKAELCDKCGSPILNFLKKYEFMKKEEIKSKK
ncbi:MAG: hypothetical protein ABH956_01975 [Candidatus Nealsonbacteria bacterium]